MARGQKAEPGAVRTAVNGYHYTRTKDKWRLTHHLVAEKTLGRPLRDDERAIFKDKDKTNLSPDNIVVTAKGNGTKEKRKAQIRARIAELQAELDELEQG